MEEKIVSLKQQGLTLKQIAAELDVPIGKVQYAWRKWRNQQQEVEAVAPVKQKRETKKVKTSVTTSRKQVASAKETANVSTSPLLEKGPEGYWKLPDRYNVDFMHAVVQSPNAVYVCWEVSDLVKETLALQFMRRWEELPKAFRILDVTLLDYNSGHANRFYTFDLPEMTNSWFVRPLDPNTTYVFEFGIRTMEGEFLPIVASNPLDTPRAEPVGVGRFAEPVRRWQYGEVDSPELLDTLPKYAAYRLVR
ncbi:DUF4912 domain-containing protein [Exiguobacterium sp. MER 193]|uniref:DUF4912 domain-containing protein n=1 Tax=Exiguobacterium sp. MER 193 TaxID=2939564 RepID=UPI00203AB722|nr:DUF4912 domain-containing protein [Exiguobacterium sp. MER 193]MCM3278995.1 DUF4912 domain-containing protein [Exiguobacterium sp. MER 193]